MQCNQTFYPFCQRIFWLLWFFLFLYFLLLLLFEVLFLLDYWFLSITHDPKTLTNLFIIFRFSAGIIAFVFSSTSHARSAISLSTLQRALV